MKKGDIVPVKISNLIRLNAAECEVIDPESHDILTREPKIKVKNAVPGKRALVRITRKRKNKAEGKLVEYLDENLEFCNKCSVPFNCGGCTFNIISRDEELNVKFNYLQELFNSIEGINYELEGLETVSEAEYNYRNKMEYSFGNAKKDGELTLGLHAKGRFHDILNTDGCMIVPEDFETIRKAVLEYFKDQNVDFYHKYNHQGFLRYLVLREGTNTGEILVNLITSSQESLDETSFTEMLKNLDLKGEIKGILWTISDNVADAVKPESEKLLFGEKVFEDRILSKTFKITPYSFFQVNTKAFEHMFEYIRKCISQIRESINSPILFDLYSGTGSIGILLSDLFQEVYSIELNKEAVEIAKENALNNNVKNINFIAGDVLENAEKLSQKPGCIVLDPPRSGIHPKALKKILNLDPEYFIYVSCNPVSLSQDLPQFFEKGYILKRLRSFELFPMTTNVETVALLEKTKQV